MKKLLILIMTLMLCACTQSLSELPKPELADGIRGSQFGIDKNINEETIDDYLGRSDSVYIDCRMLKDEANYEAIGGDSYLSGYVKGFEVVPYPYLCNVTGLPPEVGDTYSGTTLFTKHDDGTYSANYEESDKVLEALFPKDKVIFLMCGGGGYASMTKSLLVSQGYDGNRIYNTGGFWYYKGKNAVSTKRDDGTYDFSGVSYHEIDFKSLTPVEGYDPDGKGTDIGPRPKDSAIITLEDTGFLENSDNTFALLIYLPGCTSCASFKPVVEELAASGQLPVYEISFDLIKDLDDFRDVRYTPSMFLYKEGKPVAFLDAGNKDDILYYENVKNLSTWAAGYLDIEIIEGEAINKDTGCDDSACTLG